MIDINIRPDIVLISIILVNPMSFIPKKYDETSANIPMNGKIKIPKTKLIEKLFKA